MLIKIQIPGMYQYAIHHINNAVLKYCLKNDFQTSGQFIIKHARDEIRV